MSAHDILDRHDRPLRSLRLSVTDRCNLRCSYCMPEEDYVWLPRRRLLHFEELCRLVRAFTRVGVDRVRLTGGEPLLRRELDELVRELKALSGLREVTLTTNALRLARSVEALRRAGLDRVTVSLDTLRPERYRDLTRRDDLESALAGIRSLRPAGFEGSKLNMVVMRDTNDDELITMLEFARDEGLELRFIEYMDVGGATNWSEERVVSRAEILARIGEHFGEVRPVETHAAAPARRFALSDGTRFGVIASTTAPFCSDCDRSRLTADGRWFTCLYAREGFPLGEHLRAGEDDDALEALLRQRWGARADRGAEERLRLDRERGALAPRDELKNDPHLEMHTRGG